MAALSTGPLIDRIITLLQTYLNTEINGIDTADNAISTTGEGNFTTPDVESVDMVAYNDTRTESPIRIIVRPGGRTARPDLQYTGTSGRLDTEHRIDLEIIVDTVDMSWKETGAARRAERICRGVESIITAYPLLNVPGAATALAAIQGAFCTFGSANATEEIDDNMARRARVRLPLTVRVITAR